MYCALFGCLVVAVIHRTVRVWIKRNTGQYWPTICHTVPGKTTLFFMLLIVVDVTLVLVVL